jgi:hypothetical protein
MALRYNTKKKDDLMCESSWEALFLAMDLLASDEQRMMKGEEERDPTPPGERGDFTRGLHDWSMKYAKLAQACGNLGFYACTAWSLYRYSGGNFQRYSAAKKDALAAVEQVRALIEGMPLDCKR